MCGIAGLVSPKRDVDVRAAGRVLLRSLHHRGPDDHGWLTASHDDLGSWRVERGRGEPAQRSAEVMLLHRRLSILDLSEAGWQPMATLDGRHHIVFNGEIYNYVELRRELERLGEVFHSASDTEVLLRALARWGLRALPRLIGMFAFAILDTREKTLVLARDFFGIKPLYYTKAANRFLFASEVPALLALPWTGRKVHARRLHGYLTTGITDYGPDTLLEGIQQLPAAHYLKISLDHPCDGEPVRYWSAPLDHTLDISYQEATVRLRDLFVENVRLHLRSDVPVGAALSGGIDSSAIVAAMRHLEPSLELHTFSYIADDPAISEEQWVEAAAGSVHALQHKIHPDPNELVDDLERLIRAQGEPFGSTSIYAQHRVFRRARENGVTVMLDGQGADEMLGGYRFYLSARLASLVRQGRWPAALAFLRRASKLPGSGALTMLRQTAGFLASSRLKAAAKQAFQGSVMPAWLNARWFEDQGSIQPLWPNPAGSQVLRQQLHHSLFESSLPMLLRYEDRNSMAYSIESRVPFLTPALVEFLLSLPEDYLIGPSGLSKRIFRDAMRGLVPDGILDRRDKIGFATPEKRWLRDLRPWVDSTLRSPAVREIPALNYSHLWRDWQGVLDGSRPFDFRVWRWVNFIRWAEIFEVQFDAARAQAA